MNISAQHYDWVRDYMKRRAAIVLEADKKYLVYNRLLPVALKANLKTVDDLISRVMLSQDGGLTQELVDALTTNETYFFRDVHPFDFMRDTLFPEIIKRRAASRVIRIWSAASSTGQEAYTMAMVLRRHFPQTDGWRFDILGTDLSTAALKKASEGVYTDMEVKRGLPDEYRLRYFKPQGANWVIDPALRAMVSFKQLNLFTPWTGLGPFDLVMLRNVLIYFDAATRKEIVSRVHRVLEPSGVLMVGTSEIIPYAETGYAREQTGATIFYRATR